MTLSLPILASKLLSNADPSFYHTRSKTYMLLSTNLGSIIMQACMSLQLVPTPPPRSASLFLTTLGIPICNAKTTNFEGTGGFFFMDIAKPGILHLLAARHVLFNSDREENTLYKYRERSGDAQKKVMFMGEGHIYSSTFSKHPDCLNS